jgi:hypothetical protein
MEIPVVKFGRHKGKTADQVPVSWFIYLYDRSQLKGELLEYASTHVNQIMVLEEKRLAVQKSEEENP